MAKIRTTRLKVPGISTLLKRVGGGSIPGRRIGGVPFLLESVSSSLSETCLPHGSKRFAVVQMHAEENTLSRLPLIIFAKILGKRTDNVT